MIEVIFLATFITISFAMDTPESLPHEIPVLIKESGQYINYVYLNPMEPRVSTLHNVVMDISVGSIVEAPDQLRLEFQDSDQVWKYQYRLFSTEVLIIDKEIGIIYYNPESESSDLIIDIAKFALIVGIAGIVLFGIKYYSSRKKEQHGQRN